MQPRWCNLVECGRGARVWRAGSCVTVRVRCTCWSQHERMRMYCMCSAILISLQHEPILTALHLEAALMTLHVLKMPAHQYVISALRPDVTCTWVSTFKAGTRSLIATFCICIGASASTICLHLNL